MIVWIVEVPARCQNGFCDELSLASFWLSLRYQNCIPDMHACARRTNGRVKQQWAVVQTRWVKMKA